MKAMLSFETKIFMILLMISGIIFTVYPQLDLTLAHFFWNKQQGFLYSGLWINKVIYIFIPLFLKIVGASLFLYLFISCFKWQRFPYQYRRQAAFLLIALLLGPCLVTNLVLKDHWGRARPYQIEEFGGTKQFTPALTPSDQCEKNCSFTAGHPSGAFYFFAFAMLIENARRRKKYELATICFGLITGLVRLSQGKHFLSDSVFSGLINIGIIILTYHFVIGRYHARKMIRYKPDLSIPVHYSPYNEHQP